MPGKSKKNGAGEGSIRKRGANRWEARVTTGHDPATGRQIQKSLYGRTREEVAKKLTEIKSSLDNGTYVEPSKMKVGEWIQSWLLNYARMRIKESTYENYKALISAYIVPGIGAKALNELKTKDLQIFYNRLHERGKIGRYGGKNADKGLSASTIKHVHNIIHQALSQACKESLIRNNPDDACVLPKGEKRKITTLPIDDLAIFLQEASKGNHYALFYLDLCTGLRRGELLGLQWTDIDFEKGILIVKRQLNRVNKQLHFSTLKTANSNRIIKLPDSALDVLNLHKQAQIERRHKAEPVWEEHDLVFCNELGGPLDPSGIYHYYKRLLKRSGFSSYRFHDLRHTFATIALQNGVDVKTIQETLGHYSAAFTLQVYGHVTRQMQDAAAKKIDAFLTKKANRYGNETP